MPTRQAKIKRVRVQVSIPKNLFEAAKTAAGGAERGVSGVIGAALSAWLGVPYAPPPRGRPTLDPPADGG